MEFKGILLEVGDIVAFQTEEIPMLQAAVIRAGNGKISLVNPRIGSFSSSGVFNEKEVKEIKLIYKVDEAIPLETGNRFVRDQFVSARLEDGTVNEGKVIAAFASIVIAECDKTLLVGMAEKFNPI